MIRVSPPVMAAFSLIGLVAWFGSTAQAYSPDPKLLADKGFSPQSIRAITVQTAHQQWQTPPAPIRTPWQQVRRNIYINDYVGNFDEFCAGIIRERQ